MKSFERLGDGEKTALADQGEGKDVARQRRALAKESMARFRAHLDAGKPLIGIRTASHAFDAKGPVPSGETVMESGGKIGARCA